MDTAAVHAWIEGLAAPDPAAADCARLESAAGLVRRLRNWPDAREVAIAAGLQAVSGFPEKNLADSGLMSLREADRVVGRAEVEDAAPLFAAALAEGRTSGRHLDVYRRIADQLPTGASAVRRRRGPPCLGCVREHGGGVHQGRAARRRAVAPESDKEARLAR
jgi:hypothetical protein